MHYNIIPMISEIIVAHNYVGIIIFCIIASLFLLIPFSMIIIIPKRIELSDDCLTLIWPWKRMIIAKDAVKKIRLKQHRIKSVWILIYFKNNYFLKIFPIIFNWSFQDIDYGTRLKLLQAWVDEHDEGVTH